jgi:hypothetical protein
MLDDAGQQRCGRGEAGEAESERVRDLERDREPDRGGVTLPSLTLDDDDMLWDNRLPPLLPWDEIP